MAAIHTVQPGWFSIRGAAVYTGFSESAIRNAAKEGRFPVARVSVRGAPEPRIRREHLDAWIEGRDITFPPETEASPVPVKVGVGGAGDASHL